MKEAFLALSSELKKFILDETGVSEQKMEGMSDDDLLSIYDKMCDIEVEETMAAGDDDLSERGEKAVEIVTIVGNTFD